MVVNCPNVIPRHKQDKQLLDKMFAERNGIVYKAVMALRTAIDNGYRFSEPESVENARQDYRNSNSSVISFAEECLCPWPDGKINNHTYTGNLLLQKTFSENHLTKKKRYNEGQLPMYHIQNSHEAIIPLEQFNAVQAEIKRRAEKYAKPHRNKGNYLFSGLLVCGICGKHYRRKNTAAGPVWICPTYNTMGKAACPSKRIPESILIDTTMSVVGSLEALTGKITAVRAENGNRLVFCFQDGTDCKHLPQRLRQLWL